MSGDTDFTLVQRNHLWSLEVSGDSLAPTPRQGSHEEIPDLSRWILTQTCASPHQIGSRTPQGDVPLQKGIETEPELGSGGPGKIK